METAGRTQAKERAAPARCTLTVLRARMLLAVLAALGIWAASGIVWQPEASAAGFVVTDAGDAPDVAPGDGACKTAVSVCTLRAAIMEANALAGPDTITMGFGGPVIVSPMTALPALSTEITLDGTAGAGKVVLRGSSAPAGSEGLVVGGTLPVIVRDIEIIQWDDPAIYATGSGPFTLEGAILSDSNSYGLYLERTGGPIDIGGGTAAEGNEVHLNGASGAFIGSMATDVTVQGNRIGLLGAACAGANAGAGLEVAAGSAVIGGISSGEENIISCNIGSGVSMLATATGANVLYNKIGTNTAGAAGFGNGVGVTLASDLTYLEGNTIVSSAGSGVLISSPLAAGNLLVTNFIQFNGGDGIEVVGGDANQFSANSIDGNGGLGIDLAPDGVTANDGGDGDSGANALQNFPVLVSALTNNSTIVDVVGTLNSTPNATFTVEFYAVPGACDASGYGEGNIYLGALAVTTDAAGDTDPFEFVSATAVGPGSSITATASDPGAYNTSEFSDCVTVTACLGTDVDCDGYDDNVVLAHPGPSNTDPTRDNCIGTTNNLQLNTDGNFIDLTPPKANDDRTWVMSDASGDACDFDRDGDGLPDGFETAGGCAFLGDPLKRDTDYDRYLDAAECAIGTNGTDASSKPTTAQCVLAAGAASNATDTDADGVKDHVEFCQYGSDPGNANSDGDACNDGRETGNVDGNQTINGADLGLIASAQVLGAYPNPYSGNEWRWDMDVDKNGTVNAADLGLGAAKFGACP